jgi:hypothetical protein
MDPLVTGRRVLLALGLWLSAAVVMRRCVPLDGGDSVGWWAVALVELDRDPSGDGVR